MLTIIIVNWNGGDLLLRCLESIRASETSFPVKVIVVDNDSSDGSREAAQAAFPEFNIFNSGANLGFGRANNLARDLVDTPLVLFLNPDTELRKDTLERSARCLLADPEIGALGCKMLYESGEVQLQDLQWHPTPWTVLAELLFLTKGNLVRFRRWLPIYDPNKSAYVNKLYGAYIMSPRKVLDAAGWFDERFFMYGEDVDLCRGIMAGGRKLFYCSEAEIVHVMSGASSKAPSAFAVLMKNESVNKFIEKHHGALGSSLHRGVVLLGSLVRIMVACPYSIAVRLSRNEKAKTRSRHSLIKHKLMFLWALGMRKPIIATKASTPADRGTPSVVNPELPAIH